MSAPFLTVKSDVSWERGARAWVGTIDGVKLTCESRWWGNQWNVTGESQFAVPEKMILFVSQRGMDHGFWRDLLVGDSAFDDQFFIFCDSPALLPIILGEATRGALRDQGPNRHEITLYVRDGRVKTTGMNLKGDETALDRHLAIHRALGEDHGACLKMWQERIGDAAGRADMTWPPTATLLRPTGAMLVHLSWFAPSSRDSADWDDAAQSLRTEITAHDDTERKKWSLREVGPTVACTHELAGRRFVLLGALPFKLAQLEAIISRADISSIRVNAKDITVGVRGIATARQIEGATRIIHLVIQATMESSSPYR